MAQTTKSLLKVLSCALLALLCGAQALSTVLTKNRPELALATFPWNAGAYERLAFVKFSEAVEDDGLRPDEAAKVAKKASMKAIKLSPLSPDAHAILAFAAPTQETIQSILSSAASLNRRDLNLQVAVLDQALLDEDVTRSLLVIDQILRAHPEYSDEFFTALTEIFARSNTPREFAELLDGSAPWHEEFLAFALRDGRADRSLARTRPFMTDVPEGFDEALIAGLVKDGEARAAYAIYKSLDDPTGKSASSGTFTGWKANYPPFDWLLESSPGFRAEIARDSADLLIEVQPGKGGVIASRLVRLDATPRSLSTRVVSLSGDLAQKIRTELQCYGAPNLLQQFELKRGENQIPIPQRSEAGCEFIYLQFYARALRSETGLAITVSPPRVLPR